MGVHHSVRVRKRLAHRVMVSDDHLEASLVRPRHSFMSDGAAIDGDDQSGIRRNCGGET